MEPGVAAKVEPDAVDLVYQGVPRPPQFKRSTQTTDEYFAKFDLPRRKAESRMQMDRASPEAFVSIARAQIPSLPRTTVWLALASLQGSSGIAAAARQMRW